MSEQKPQIPWSRYVALGDSFTEGVGDTSPASPGGLRGWADRLAEQLSLHSPDFAYANLAVRGKLIQQVIDEQLEAAIELHPDLISFSAGGNDVIRPGADPDRVAEKIDEALQRLAETDATIILFTGIDVRFQPVLRTLRGRVAIFNENLRALGAKYDCVIVDQWALREMQDKRYWCEDRLHLNALGHHTVTRAALSALNVPHTLTALEPPALPEHSWRKARKEDVVWAKEHLFPWVLRRIKHVSSGDRVPPKRPNLAVYREVDL